MADHEGLLRAEEQVQDDERPEGIVGHDPAGVAYHMGVPILETGDLGPAAAGVPARDDCEATRRRRTQLALREAVRVAAVGLEDLIDDAHPASLAPRFEAFDATNRAATGGRSRRGAPRVETMPGTLYAGSS